MASPLEIANDLDAHARIVNKKRMPDSAAAIRRGAETIREMARGVRALKAENLALKAGAKPRGLHG